MGYSPGWPFAEGLGATVRWYAENRDWWEPLKAPRGAARAGNRGAAASPVTGAAQADARFS